MLSQATSFSLHTETAQLLLGIEQEFELFSAGEKLDFRTLFPSVVRRVRSIPFRDRDTAVVLDAGYMLACDGKCAEFATAPVNFLGDGLLTLARETTRCRGHMLRLLKSQGVRDVRGYSTHISISVPDGREWEISEEAASTFAPGLILLMEARSSPGLLIRPRRGRLEIGSEYIDDEAQLSAALVFLAGSVQSYLQNDVIWREFPRISLNRWEEANIRPGIYLPHDAFGESIHEFGRAAVLKLDSGRKITSGEALAQCTDLVFRELNEQVSPQTIEALQEFTRGERTLQIEREMDPSAIAPRRSGMPAPESKNVQMIVSAPDLFGVTPRFVDWEGVAFEISASEESVVAGIPWAYLPEFFNEAREKGIGSSIPETKVEEPVLNSLRQFERPQLYKKVDPASLGVQAHNIKGKKGKIFKPLPPSVSTTVSRVIPQPTAKENIGKVVSTRNIAIGVVLILALVIGIVIQDRITRGNSGMPVSEPILPAPNSSPSAAPIFTAPIPLSEVTVPVRIRIITTSDWTTFKINGAQLTGITIKSVSSEASDSGFDQGLGQFHLNQPLEQAGTRSVEMVADFSLSTDTTRNLVFAIDRGHIGATTVEFFVITGSEPVLVKTFVWDGIISAGQNLKTFDVAPSLLGKAQEATSQPEQTHLRIHIITSSDWTTVGLGGVETSDITIKSASPQAITAGYDERLGQFNLSQPIEIAGTQVVEMVADFSLSLKETQSVSFLIARGYIGATTVDLYVVNGSEEVLITTFMWSGINPGAANLKSFKVDSSLFDITENQVGMDVNIRASFCSSGIGGMTFNMPEPVTNANNFQVKSGGNVLDCAIVDGRLACTGVTPDTAVSGTICQTGEQISNRCVEFTVQIPACKSSGGGNGGGDDTVITCGPLEYLYDGQCLPIVR